LDQRRSVNYYFVTEGQEPRDWRISGWNSTGPGKYLQRWQRF
jgi:hypothetical protein